MQPSELASSPRSLQALVMRLPIDPDLDGTAPHLDRARLLGLIALGGVAGSLARAGVADAVPVAAHGWPAATLAVNVAGSLLLAVVLTVQHERFPGTRWLRPLLGTGFCGGFTTFSTFAVETAVRAGNGRAGLALGYVGLSVAACVAAVLVGVVLARSLSRLADPDAVTRRLEHAAAQWPEDGQ